MITAVSSTEAYQGLVAQQAQLPTRHVERCIKTASLNSGVEFSYLLNNASQESGLNPTAKAKSSSATGLFQFVDQTWLRMVKAYGDKYGLSEQADSIKIGSDGVARVANAQTKKAILALRKDPEISAHLAAELTNENRESLKSSVGGKIGDTELYLAHFLGVGGARNFISTMRSNPTAKAADVLPTAASANTSIFYDKSGNARTVAQVYKRFAQKFENTGSDGVGATRYASANGSSSKVAGTDALPQPLYSANSNVSDPMMSATSGIASIPSALSSTTGQPHSAMSSTFATMVLSQMDTDSLLATAREQIYTRTDEGKKRPAYAAVGNVG